MKSADRPRVPTMADVAERAGVSRALVSIVFRGVAGASPATRERVMQAAEELDYRPDARARLLGRSRSRTVGVVFALHHEFHAELVDELYRAADGTAYDLGLGATGPSRSEERAVRSLLDHRCEAIVLVGPTLSRPAIDELAAKVPVVVVARSLRPDAVDVVRTDDVAGARLAVEHLAGLGHGGIVHVDGLRAPGATERRRGYRAAVKDLGLEPHLVPGGLTEQAGEEACEAVLAVPAATAVAAFNDHCAAGLLAAARARGIRVPDDLSLCGYDDSRIASLATISLTTVAQDAAVLASSALDLAITRAGDPGTAPTEVVVPPRLVVRSTTGRPGPH